MRYKITDGVVEAVIDSHGAELKSLKLRKLKQVMYCGSMKMTMKITQNYIKYMKHQVYHE